MSESVDFDRIRQFVFSETGLTYYQCRENELRRKIDKALKCTGASDYQQYLELLSVDADAGSKVFDDLISELTIGETHFFRDETLFTAVRDVALPVAIEKNKHKKRLWIWSAGCATGEEVYTIAMILQIHFANQLQGWDVRITGTDINRAFLHRALQGVYTEWSFRGTPPQIINDCFIQQGKTWRIRPEYKRYVAFQYHNLVKTPYPSVFHNLFAFDMIFCRNVMIYFNSDTVKRIVLQFQQALVKDGWLIVGHADHSVKHFSTFKTIMQLGTSFYRNSQRSDWVQEKIVLPTQSPLWSDLQEPSEKHLVNSPGVDFIEKGLNEKKAPPLRPRKVKKRGSVRIAPFEKTVAKGLSGSEALAALMNRGDWDNAKQLCQDLLATQPMDAVVHLLAAFIAEQEGRIDDAIDALKKALYLDRKFVVGHYHLALMFQKIGELQKAEKGFSNVAKLLEDYNEDDIFEIADGISAGQLKQLSHFHLEILKG